MQWTKVSEAVVFSRIGYSWVPEILALSAQCYEKKGMPDTARNVFRELKVFFQTSKNKTIRIRLS